MLEMQSHNLSKIRQLTLRKLTAWPTTCLASNLTKILSNIVGLKMIRFHSRKITPRKRQRGNLVFTLKSLLMSLCSNPKRKSKNPKNSQQAWTYTWIFLIRWSTKISTMEASFLSMERRTNSGLSRCIGLATDPQPDSQQWPSLPLKHSSHLFNW